MKQWLDHLNGTVLTMACLRFISSFIEFIAAILIVTNNDVKKALMINGMLALVGPIVMVSSFTIRFSVRSRSIIFWEINHDCSRSALHFNRCF